MPTNGHEGFKAAVLAVLMSPILGRLDPTLPNVAALRPLGLRRFAVAVNPVKNGRVQNRDFLRPAGVLRVSWSTGSIGAPRFRAYRIKRVRRFTASFCKGAPFQGVLAMPKRRTGGACSGTACALLSAPAAC